MKSAGEPVSRVLFVTNDFPTRRGGIETFVLSLCEHMDPDEVVVYTASMPGRSRVRHHLALPGVSGPLVDAASDARPSLDGSSR